MTLSNIIKTIVLTGILLVALPAVSMAAPLQCKTGKAPIINIRPKTKDIKYDLGKSSAQLSQIKTNTKSPYGLNADQTTGGLRRDEPIMTTEIKFNFTHDPRSKSICLSYNTINIDILLHPTIYIAKEFNHGRCAIEVRKHEQKHVAVDRKVTNKYTKIMGKAIQRVVNKTTTSGPFHEKDKDAVQKNLQLNIENVVKTTNIAMAKEMDHLQQQVDSREEYDRVSQYCTNAAKQVFGERQKN